MKKNIAIILSGCGVYDGSEIYETTLTFLAIEHHGSVYQCFAPNIQQAKVVNHMTGEVMEGETRNVLVESARLCRGEIKDLAELNPDEFDGLIIPGGFGAASNLSDFAEKGAQATVHPLVHEKVRGFADAKKPAGFICIAPALVPMIYRDGVSITIGNDAQTANTLEEMGARHVNCDVEEHIVDMVKKVVSTPAFMLATSVTEAQHGIDSLVMEVLSLTNDDE